MRTLHDLFVTNDKGVIVGSRVRAIDKKEWLTIG